MAVASLAARPPRRRPAWRRCGTSTLIAFLFGIGSAFDAPARQSFVSEMVGPDDLTNAVGLNSATFNMARIVGPALAGLMIGALGGGAGATGWVDPDQRALLRRGRSGSSSTWTPLLLHTPKPVAARPACSSRASATCAASRR